jgi:cytochrome c oxidase assembly factor CtaG
VSVSDALRLLRSWEPAPVPWLAFVLTAVTYVVAARHVSRGASGQPWPAYRGWCFMAGLAVTAFALVGPPGAWDDVFFYAHMTQHILLTMLAAPLLVLGDPVLLAMRAASSETRRRWLVPCLRSRVVHALTHPIVGWVFFVGVMGVTHLPSVYDAFLEHPLLHDYVEHPLYLASGLVFFQPLLIGTAGTRHVRHWVRLVSLFTVMIPMAMIGFFIFATPRLAYGFYGHVPRPFGPAPVGDQHLAGILMWSTSMVLSVAWLVVAGSNWMQAEELRTRRAEREPSLLPRETSA